GARGACGGGDGNGARARSGRRTGGFDGRAVECPVYDRPQLRPGASRAGPAIVEEFGATTVLFPRQRIDVDRFGNMILTRAAPPPSAERLGHDPRAGPTAAPDHPEPHLPQILPAPPGPARAGEA